MRNAIIALAALLALSGCENVGLGVASLATSIVSPSLPWNADQRDVRCHWEPSEDAPIVERRQVCEYAQ